MSLTLTLNFSSDSEQVATGCQNVKPVQAEANCLLDSCSQSDVTPHPSAQSVLGVPLQSCSSHPVTGFFRDSYCRTDSQDRGVHVVCAEVTEDFLSYTKSKGNDLSTPAPRYGFVGLKPGDRWCLCAVRWAEAYKAGKAPPVDLEATHQRTLRYVSYQALQSRSAAR